MSLEDAIKIAHTLSIEFETRQTWNGNWAVNKETQEMMDTYNKIFHTQYSINCRPCIGKVALGLLRFEKQKQIIAPNDERSVATVAESE